jgi:hypothetical protein
MFRPREHHHLRHCLKPVENLFDPSLFEPSFLFANLLWGSAGAGYWIYGKKQREMVPMIGGIVMIAVSCFIGSWLLMSLICIALMVAVYWLMRQGY